MHHRNPRVSLRLTYMYLGSHSNATHQSNLTPLTPSATVVKLLLLK